MAAAAPLRVIEGSMDKDKALAAALSQIERNFGKGSVMKFGAGAIAQAVLEDNLVVAVDEDIEGVGGLAAFDGLPGAVGENGVGHVGVVLFGFVRGTGLRRSQRGPLALRP